MKIIGQVRTSFNSTRRIVRINNTNTKDAVNPANRDFRQTNVSGQGGRRVNISFDIMNRRKIASSGGSINKEFMAPGYSRVGKESNGRLGPARNSGAFRRGGRARGGGGGFKGRNSGHPLLASRGRGSQGSFRGGKRFQNNRTITTAASLVSYNLKNVLQSSALCT